MIQIQLHAVCTEDTTNLKGETNEMKEKMEKWIKIWYTDIKKN